MSDEKRYIVTPLAGRLIAGRKHGPTGSDIMLTPEEARYELLLHSIVDPNDPAPEPYVEPPIEPTDIVEVRRDGFPQPYTANQFAAFLGGLLILTKARVGLDKVENLAPNELPVSAATTAAIAAAVAEGVGRLTAGSPQQLDSFLEVYNRFLSDEGALAALTAAIGTKASQVALDALAALVATKAPQSAVTTNNLAATTDPTASNDDSQGYAVGSLWLRTDTGDVWRCRKATAAAAVWMKMQAATTFGYVAGRWYGLGNIGTYGPGNPQAVGRPSFFPWVVTQRFTLAALDVYVSTAASAGNMQLAVYRSDPATKMPVGAPMVTTASMPTGATGIVSAAASVQLNQGLYWIGFMADTGSVGFTGYAQSMAYFGRLIGSTAESDFCNVYSANAYFVLGAVGSYGTWPNLPSGYAFAQQTYGGNFFMPVVNFKVASVP